MKLFAVSIILVMFLPGLSFAGELADKAAHYDAWTPTWHRPGYGAITNTHFTDESLTEIDRLGARGDSTEWTGTYLESQVFRYRVTGDPEAYGEILSTVETLHHHLQVTGRCGFIARYRGPDEYPFNEGCPNEHCLQGEGEYAGDIFLTNTSRDMYIGWFAGMAAAFDVVEDEAVRERIIADVTEVVDALMRQHWWIVDVDGLPTSAAPNILSTQQAAWSLVAAHVTGEPRFWDEYNRLAAPSMHTVHRLGSISFFNKYAQHFGNKLSHQNAHMLMRLSHLEGLNDDFEFWKSLFLNQWHRWTHMVHNPYFELIHWSVLDEPDEAMGEMIIEDLTLFRDAPNVHVHVETSCIPLDPISVWLHDLQERFPWLKELMGGIDPQTAEPRPVDEQCSSGFLWDGNPWGLECGPEDLTRVNPGVDYLIADWMARYYELIDETM